MVEHERCGGDGVIRFNPSKSVPPDPQLEDEAKCPGCEDCNGKWIYLSGEELGRLVFLCEFEASGFDPENGPTRDRLADKLRGGG